MIKLIKKYGYASVAILSAVLVSACGNDDAAKTEKTEVKAKAPASMTANSAYELLKKSNLVSGDPEDVTSKFEGSEGLVKAIRTPEADIIEYKKESQAKSHENPDLNAYSVKNIYVLLKANQDKSKDYINVLENKKAMTSSSTKENDFAKYAKSDFDEYASAFYKIPSEERSIVFDTYVKNKTVSWSGIVADLDAINDSIVLVSSKDYKKQDWSTISTEKKELMPYTIIAELKDKSSKSKISLGDSIKVRGVVGARGDEKSQFNWKLYESEIL